MRERPTVRVVLLDPLERVLLIHCHDDRITDPVDPDGERPAAFWVLPGGGIEPGESLVDAARRELREETGLTAVALGRVVLERDKVMAVDGVPIHFRERYLIGRTRATTISWDGIEEAERGVFLAHHWWTLAELRGTVEVVFPEGLADLVADLIGAAPQQTAPNGPEQETRP